MGSSFCFIWGVLGFAFFSQKDPSKLEWFFLGKNRKKAWRVAPLHIFWTVWKKRNRLAFKDESLSIQRLKHSFILTFWAKAKLFIDDYPLTIANFLTGWVLSRFVVLGCLYLLVLLNAGVQVLYSLSRFFSVSFIYEISFTYQKNLHLIITLTSSSMILQLLHQALVGTFLNV